MNYRKSSGKNSANTAEDNDLYESAAELELLFANRLVDIEGSLGSPIFDDDSQSSDENISDDDNDVREDEDFSIPIKSEQVLQTIDYKESDVPKTESEVPESEERSESTLRVESSTGFIHPEIFPSHEEVNDAEDEDEPAVVEIAEEPAEKPRATGAGEMTVVFKTISDERMTTRYKADTTIKKMKENLGAVFGVEAQLIDLSFRGTEPGEGTALSALLGESDSAVEFFVGSAKPRRYLSPGQFDRYRKFEKSVAVKLPIKGGIDVKNIAVKVEDQCFFKEWQGGYVNKKTKAVYHNKLVQTLPRRRPDRPKIYSRSSQTPVFPLKEFESVTAKNKATQMSRRDHYVPNVGDRIVVGVSKRFASGSKRNTMTVHQLVTAVVKLRRFFRGLRTKHEATVEREQLELREANELKAKAAMRESLMAANRREILGTAFPVNRADFYMLYLMVGKWWNKEMHVIRQTKRGEARKVACADLLRKEIDLLRIIDGQRNRAKREVLQKHEISFVETCARPILFRNVKGQMSSVDNVETQQAREYQEILSAFLREGGTVEERIDALQNMKHLITKYGYYEYSNEVLQLIDRECDLLGIGMPMTGAHLRPLRARIEQLLQAYLHTYLVNPRCVAYEKPRAAKTVRTLFQCAYCRQLKRASDFNVHVRMTRFDMCHSCEWMNNIACKRTNLSPYARLLQHVRQLEMDKCCTSSICYVLQPVGMTYLVQKIWNDESVISNCKRLDELRMIRFKKEEDWSPWNCILLTLEESAAHLQISRAEHFYGEWLLAKIHQKHLRAKAVFLPLILNDREMCRSRIWFDVSDSDKFLHPSHISRFATSGDFTFLSSY